MRQLPAPGQAGRFLKLDQGAGLFHAARLTLAGLLAAAGGTTAVLLVIRGGALAVSGAIPAGLLALAALAYLAGVLLPFSRHPLRLRLRSLSMLTDRFLLRTALRSAGLVGDKTDPLLRAFVQANNAAVRALYRHRKPKNVMVLLPHCVVWTRCPKKVIKDLANCRECDQCQMEEILGVADRAALPVGIAVRSAEAYTQARGMGPDLTLAVACDDRLVKGITRVPELPAFALPLDLPKESCHDNLVDLSGLHQALDYFLGPERVAGRETVPVDARLTDQAVSSRRVRLPALSPPAVGARPASQI